MDDEKAAQIVKDELKKSESSLFPSGGSGVVSNTATPQSSEVSTQGLISQALEAAKNLREQLDRKEKLILQEQEIQARRMLSGRSEAGITEPVKTKDELNKEAAKKLLEGTGLKIW